MSNNFEELESKVQYNNYTAFVYEYNNMIMYSGEEITEDTLSPFTRAEHIFISKVDDLPQIKAIMQENLLAELKPAANIVDDNFNNIVKLFENNKAEIAWCSSELGYVYMLII